MDEFAIQNEVQYCPRKLLWNWLYEKFYQIHGTMAEPSGTSTDMETLEEDMDKIPSVAKTGNLARRSLEGSKFPEGILESLQK